jgi:hypothetical protein
MSRFLRVLIVSIIGIGGMIAAATPARAAVSGGISHVAVDATSVTISGTVNTPDIAVDLFALDPSQEPADYSGGTPIASIAADSSGTFSATVPRQTNSGDR